MFKRIFSIITTILITFTLNIIVYADKSMSIVKVNITNTQISAYINAETDSCTAMLGTTPCEIISYSKAEKLPSDTLILVDASGSIPKAVQNKTSEFLSALIDGKLENERFAIASFGTDVNYLCGYTSDRYELSKAAERLEYSEKYTYIYSTVDNVLKNIDDKVFTKIIVISDGVENSKDGITYDEILKTVSDTHCPIYTIGVEHNNRESLKKFYSFSRNSAAESVALTSDTDVSEVCGIVNECRNYICVTIDIPDKLADGSIKYLKLSSENFECGIDIRMPVIELNNSEITTTETISETESVQETSIVPHKKINFVLIIGIAAAAIIVSAIIIIIFKFIEKNGKRSEKNEPVVDQGGIDTIITKPNEEDITIVDDCMIKFTDINDPARSYSHALGNGIVIGRDAAQCIIVINDGFVSRAHCKVFGVDGRFYVKNLSKTKETIINDKYVLDKADDTPNDTDNLPSTGTRILLTAQKNYEKEIFNGDIIRIGHTSLRFEILK